jgi:hypothetical protein
MPDQAVVPRLTASASVPDLIGALEASGCAVVESLVDETVVRGILDELRPYMDATATGKDAISGFHTRRTGAVPTRSRTSWPLLQHPMMLGAAEHYLADKTESFHICTAVTSDLLGGQTAQPIHRDQWTYGHFPWPSGFEVEFNVLWALQDFEEVNGATRIFPGSHRWVDGLELDGAGSIAATCPVGSAIVVLGSCYHGAGANDSNSNRVALSIAYQRAWLRQGENQYLNCPPDVAATMPEELVRLLGYQRGAEALGYWRDGEDPMTAVYPNRTYHVGLGLGPDETPEE